MPTLDPRPLPDSMNTTNSGRFYAIGVGPGDPELLTVKAVNVLQRAHVVYHAGPSETEGRAWEIVRSLLRPEQEVRIVRTEPMSVVSAGDGKAHYRPAVEQIAADCRRGREVAFITEGDPTLYSTAVCVWQLLAEIAPEIPIEVVPGITSITAAAARVGWPLARKDEMLAIVPAGYHAADLHGLINTFPTVCLLKVSSILPPLIQTVETFGTQREAVYLENLGTDSEWITHRLPDALGRKGYFALVLIRRPPRDEPQGLEEMSVRSTSMVDRVYTTSSASAPLGRQPSGPAGKVWVVGLGPGEPRLLTPQAREVLQAAEVIVGYESYVKSLAPLGLGAELQGSPIGAEADRAAQALELARAGRRVALVSSGDAGVYGMASLLLEMAQDRPGVEVEVVPGVTAALAAAALLGAPLGHDFTCISLSDLRTPWELIERRLEAAGQGDFVAALYNPASQRRTWQLPRARDILLRYRRPETPVGLVDKAYRPGMRVWHTTLGGLTTDGVGTETTLIIGNSQTRLMNGRVVTPRGYDVPRTQESGIRNQESGIRNQESGIRNQESGISIDVGRQIMEESFALIERELGSHSLPPWAFAVVRRMIHASADFEFAQTLRYSPDFESAIQAALRDRVPIITDTEMVLLGIRTALAGTPGVTLTCLLNDPETTALAASAGLTRSSAGIRVAAQRYAKPMLAIGNAPTALAEALRLVEDEGWRPAAIIGMPVGFVGVEEAKRRLLGQAKVPYLTCMGRKGGSAVTAAAVNALANHME